MIKIADASGNFHDITAVKKFYNIANEVFADLGEFGNIGIGKFHNEEQAITYRNKMIFNLMRGKLSKGD